MHVKFTPAKNERMTIIQKHTENLIRSKEGPVYRSNCSRVYTWLMLEKLPLPFACAKKKINGKGKMED